MLRLPPARFACQVVLLAAAACNMGPPPQSVTIELPDAITSKEPLVVPVRARDSSGRSEMVKPPFEATVTPPDLASVGKDGTLTCSKSGDGKLQVSIKGVVGTAPLKCRLVSRLDIPGLDRVDITKGPIVLDVKAFGQDDKELTDVPVTITPSNGNPLRVNGIELKPVEVGTTELSVRAGSAERKFPVKVVKSLKPEALPMNDGKRINFSLPEGKYEIRVALKSPKPLKIEWRGAPYCDYKGGATESHVSTCVLQGKGGVVTDNPQFVDSGATDVSHDGIELFEIP